MEFTVLPWIAGAIVALLALVAWLARAERRRTAQHRPSRKKGQADRRPEMH